MLITLGDCCFFHIFYVPIPPGLMFSIEGDGKFLHILTPVGPSFQSLLELFVVFFYFCQQTVYYKDGHVLKVNILFIYEGFGHSSVRFEK